MRTTFAVCPGVSTVIPSPCGIVPEAMQGSSVGMQARLHQYALARVDEHHGCIGSRCARSHIARVLLVPRRVGDDEFTPRRREVTIGDIDGDALFALGAEAVG